MDIINAKKDRTQVFLGKTMDERNNDTEEKEKFLESAGFKLIKIYGCEFWEKFKNPWDVDTWEEAQENWEMREFVKPILSNLQKSTPINPRDALRLVGC